MIVGTRQFAIHGWSIVTSATYTTQSAAIAHCASGRNARGSRWLSRHGRQRAERDTSACISAQPQTELRTVRVASVPIQAGRGDNAGAPSLPIENRRGANDPRSSPTWRDATRKTAGPPLAVRIGATFSSGCRMSSERQPRSTSSLPIDTHEIAPNDEKPLKNRQIAGLAACHA